MQTIAIDAWNQQGIPEVSTTCRSAASGAERNDATLKVAIVNFHPQFSAQSEPSKKGITKNGTR